MAAQDQALPTNGMKANIQSQNCIPLYGMCGKENETVSHIISRSEMLTWKYYKQWKHDKVAQILLQNLCKKYDLQAATKFYDHVPEKVSQNDLVKMGWEMKKILNSKSVKMIPIIIGTLNTVNTKLGEWLKSININCSIEQMQ